MAGSTAARDNTTLIGSSFPACGSRYSGSRRGPTTSSSNIAGTPSRKTEPHQNRDNIAPPTSGPITAPAEKHSAQIPIACPICLGSGNRVRISDTVDGARIAPATPSTARAAISIAGLVEYAATTEVAPNTAAPISNNFRRPIRSPSLPIVIRNPARVNP
ncbi:hypothetical protein ABIA38_002739 [Embleya sp. AB8]